MTNSEIFIISVLAMFAYANGYLWYTNYKEKKLMQKTQNKITAKELEKHLGEYLDKVENGEKVFVEYDGELYTIVKIEKE